MRKLRSWPRGRAGHLALMGVLVLCVLAASIGVGYSVARPELSDGSEYLAKGHGVAHVNGETGRTDAEVARALATGSQQLESVRMPDGRVAVVNNDTGEVSFIDPATMAPTGEPVSRPASKAQIETLPGQTRGYLVDRERDTVEVIDSTGQPGKPVAVTEGIEGAVPVGDSIWVVTGKGEVAQITGGVRTRSVPLGVGARITVADGHPVAVTADGLAYALDGEQPRALGDTGLPKGTGAVLGSWRGSGRYVVGVDRAKARVVALDPRTGTRVDIGLPLPSNTHPQFDAPVLLDERVYVPDYAGPTLWQVDLVAHTAKPLPVPARGPGRFELKVSGGRVWANSQYAQRALIVDGAGATRTADKGTGVDVLDTEKKLDPKPPDQSTPTESPKPTKPAARPSSASPTKPATVAGAPTAQPPPEQTTVVVPSFARGTKYTDACAQLSRLGLRCESVAAGDAPGLGADEVIGSTPAAGTRIPAKTVVLVRYVGPVEVPDLVGLDAESACTRVTAAGMDCAKQPDSTPATTQESLLKVTSQQPGARQKADKGSTVTVRFPDSIALPALTGRSQGEACQVVQALHMTCTAQPGTPPAGQCPAAGAVFDQTPAAGAVGRASSAVVLRVCGGQVTVPDWIDPKPQQATDVCVAVRTQGLQCQVKEGTSAAGTGFQPGVAYDQAPKPGTQMAITAVVTITHYSDKSTIPDFTGTPDIDTACARIQDANLTCVALRGPAPVAERQVFAQDQPAGTYKFGTPITVHYSGWKPVVYSLYSADGKKTWQLTTDDPATKPAPVYRVGIAFPGWATDVPGAQRINRFTCNKASCTGVPGNLFYSRIGAWDNYNFSNDEAVFMPCPTSGTKPIYRLWKDAGAVRSYSVSSEVGGATGSEQLGCVWP
ncbi:hypothetical protein Acsp05_42390 [Actinokineospora sp. NBRC 105648]|nr:hypothetical protein Acsp05_42390 [Actinokineospora sp. NBRC 105648]